MGRGKSSTRAWACYFGTIHHCAELLHLVCFHLDSDADSLLSVAAVLCWQSFPPSSFPSLLAVDLPISSMAGLVLGFLEPFCIHSVHCTQVRTPETNLTDLKTSCKQLYHNLSPKSPHATHVSLSRLSCLGVDHFDGSPPKHVAHSITEMLPSLSHFGIQECIPSHRNDHIQEVDNMRPVLNIRPFSLRHS